MELIGVLGLVVLFIIANNREESINHYLSKHTIMNQLAPFIVCFAISFLIVIHLNLSPFNSAVPGTDSSVFLYIGKAMHNGDIPYKELFDHKGILLYFIEYFGYLIGFGNQIGVWIIELINLLVTALVLFKIANLFSISNTVCLLSTYIVLHLSSITFFVGEGGNLTEEYALPWISISLYIVVKFFITKEYKRWQIILLGVCFAFVFFLRVNMVGLWGALIVSVLVFFVKRKRIADIFKCSLLFFIGCLLVIAPLMIYFILTDSLYYMIDYYFVFNLSYTGAYSKKGIITFFFDCITFAGLVNFFIVYSMLINYKNKVLWVNFITLLFAFVSSGISGLTYAHYGIILIPFFLIPTVISISPLMEKTKEISRVITKKRVVSLVVLLCVLCVAIYPAVRFYFTLSEPTTYNELYQYISSKTTEKDDVLILENNVSTYLNTNRHTNNKFFYQVLPIDVSNRLFEEFLSELDNKPSDYIFYLKTDDSAYNSAKEPANNRERVILYLNAQCEKGKYQLEKYDSFQVYVRK